MERVEETTVRKLSQPERHDRYIKQTAGLAVVSIKGATEPEDSLGRSLARITALPFYRFSFSLLSFFFLCFFFTFHPFPTLPLS